LIRHIFGSILEYSLLVAGPRQMRRPLVIEFAFRFIYGQGIWLLVHYWLPRACSRNLSRYAQGIARGEVMCYLFVFLVFMTDR